MSLWIGKRYLIKQNAIVVKNHNHGNNILRLFDTSPNFFSPQVEQSLITSNKHGIYELLHELPNDLRLTIFRN